MKKKLLTVMLILVGIILTGIILSLSFFKGDLCTELITNTHNNVDLTDINIIYSNINYNQIKGYTLTHTTPKTLSTRFVAYSEGFIPAYLYRDYKKSFIQNNENFSMMFQDYYETQEAVYFAFPGDLSAFRILDLADNKIKHLLIDDSIYLSSMYVSHIKQVGDQLIILAGEAHSYNALIYIVDLPTLKVKSYKQLKTHPSALESSHFTLTSNGTALFIAGDKLQIYHPFTDQESFIALPFTATGVLSLAHTTLVYSEKDGILHIGLLDETFNLSSNHRLSLPSPSCTLIDLTIKEDTLFVATMDPLGIRFKNYMTGYNLLTGQLTYCLGIEDASPLMLMSIQ